MRRYLLLAAIPMAMMAAGSFTACSGGDDNGTGDASDANTPDVKKLPEAGLDGQAEAAPPVTPAGTQLAASDGIQIFGVTTDGQVIYADLISGGLFAVSETGGTPTQIGSPTGYVLGIAGKIVFVWSGVSSTDVGTLNLWQMGGTYHQVAVKSDPNAGFASSLDGNHIIFSVNANTAGTLGGYVGANADGSDQVLLVNNVDISSTSSCRPEIGFANNTTAVSATCAVDPGDGGIPSATVTAYAIGAAGDGGTSWTNTDIITSALNFWSTDTAGDKLMVATTSEVSVYTGITSLPVPIPIAAKDIENGQNGTWTFGRMQATGSNVLYSTAAGDLYISSATVPAPATLQASGVKFVRAISPDENYMVYSSNFDSIPFGSDLFLTKATDPAGSPETLVTGTTGALFGASGVDAFTADSSYAIWIENLDTTHGIGDLYAGTVAGGTPVQIATGVWQNTSATGTKVVYNNNCGDCNATATGGFGHGDIYSVDVATNQPKLLQTQADIPLTAGNSLPLSTTKDHVIYSYSLNTQSSGTPAPGGNGLYSVAIQ